MLPSETLATEIFFEVNELKLRRGQFCKKSVEVFTSRRCYTIYDLVLLPNEGALCAIFQQHFPLTLNLTPNRSDICVVHIRVIRVRRTEYSKKKH